MGMTAGSKLLHGRQSQPITSDKALSLDRVNFVMLNVDSTKWEQELDEIGVEGIPHFAFLDKEGNEEGNVVGRLPKQYFLDNVVALASGEMEGYTIVYSIFSVSSMRALERAVRFHRSQKKRA
ncbi:Thioredoxin-like protein HCF164 chloroplastic [Zea mays]|uniref:Thioredoxin-like protein HCF164 chloroplastic n=1 Tax=Zea mays TaxID=4577 RepID=A0A1D6L636_MAIZE|nr:Thioredoxin-like protein HCF164 chloroplastic [Zea mays]